MRYAYTPGRRAGRDWNFLAMEAPQGEQANFNIVPGSAAKELYEFPGRFDDSWSAEQAMKYRIQATETGFETVDAASTVRTLAPGRRFTPQDVAKPSNAFQPQVVTSIRHKVVSDPARRFHDIGLSAWLVVPAVVLVLLVPNVGPAFLPPLGVLLLIALMGLAPGTRGANRFDAATAAES